MIVKTIPIIYNYGDIFTLLPIADIHLGNLTSDLSKLKKDLQAINGKTLIIGLGDWLDSILVKDKKRYRKALDATESEAIIDKQIEQCAEIFRPYADKLIGLGDGNHEEKIIDLCGTNPTKRLCEKLSTQEHEVIYLGYSWLLQLVFRKDEVEGGGQTRTIIVRGHHGWGGGSRTEGADITKYSHDVKFWQADIFLYGHVHKLKTNDVEEGRIIGQDKWITVQKKMIVCGTYQKTYTNDTTATYAERMGYPPVSVRNPKIFIKPEKIGAKITVEH